MVCFAPMQFDLLAVDPGVHTGLSCVMVDSEVNNFELNPFKLWTHTVLFPKDFSTLEDIAGCYKSIIQVCKFWRAHRMDNGKRKPIVGFELFRLQPGKAHNSKPEGFSAMWVHAMLLHELYNECGDDLGVLRYTAGTSKSTVTNARLRRDDLWVKGSPHERDANRILWLMARRLRHG